MNGNLEFIMVKAGVPGRACDISILNTSAIGKDPWRFVKRGFYLLADGGYNVMPWCLVPFTDKHGHVVTQEETKFNFALSSTRMAVERAFGVLKARFRALGHHVVSVWHRDETIRLVLSACVLHNICRRQHDYCGLEDPVHPVADGSRPTREAVREMESALSVVQLQQRQWSISYMPLRWFQNGAEGQLRDRVWDVVKGQRKPGRELRAAVRPIPSFATA